MLLNIFNLKNYIPTECYKTVYDIDFNKLYETGKRILLFDLDNTLISYREFKLPSKVLGLFASLEQRGFKIVLISNNTTNRLLTALDGAKIDFIANAKKPLKIGFNKLYSLYPNFKKQEVILIGDQLMTDCLGANSFGIDVILVKTIERESEKWYTKINRRLEKRVLKRLYKHHPQVYQKIITLGGPNER